jgi:hypothetical protein
VSTLRLLGEAKPAPIHLNRTGDLRAQGSRVIPTLGASESAVGPEITIVVSPVVGAPGRFEARLDGDCIVASSRTPFCDAARRLIDLGYDGAAILVMKHAGTDVVALWAPLLKAAKLTVEEGPHGPRFVAFRTGPRTRVAPPPIAASVGALPNLPETNSLTSAPATRETDDVG